jgi:hypothetical protein
MAVLQALLALHCSPGIRKCRQISPLLLTLLLTLTNVSIPGPAVVILSQSLSVSWRVLGRIRTYDRRIRSPRKGGRLRSRVSGKRILGPVSD